MLTTNDTRHAALLGGAFLPLYSEGVRAGYAALGAAVAAERERRGWTQRSATIRRLAKALGWNDDHVAGLLRPGEQERKGGAGPNPFGVASDGPQDDAGGTSRDY